ncbi:MAG: hypothetical protein R2815_00995 [Flavobacteriales bacterium]|nr:hypothetical protein [Flavobacteriales bacterium]
MKYRYRISPEGRADEPTDAEIGKYRDAERLRYNYHKASELLHRRPLYKDPKAFIALVVIVLLALFIAEVLDKETPGSTPQQDERIAP